MYELVNMIQEMDIPFAYDHFAEGEIVKPPFICFLFPSSNNFAADGITYFKKNEVNLELYTDTKSLKLEKQVEKVLDNHEIFYNKSEVWINEEKLYEVLFSFELED